MFRLFKSLQSHKKFILRNPNFLSTANFATYKTTTGLAGLPVDENGKETILKLSADVLQAVKVGAFVFNFHWTFPLSTNCLIRKFRRQVSTGLMLRNGSISSQGRPAAQTMYVYIHILLAPLLYIYSYFFQVKAIEDEIGIGQIEEIIDIAKDELELIDYYHGNNHRTSEYFTFEIFLRTSWLGTGR